jgi:hypothetical protein
MASSTDTVKNNRDKVEWILLKWSWHHLHLRSKSMYALGFFVILSAKLYVFLHLGIIYIIGLKLNSIGYFIILLPFHVGLFLSMLSCFHAFLPAFQASLP